MALPTTPLPKPVETVNMCDCETAPILPTAAICVRFNQSSLCINKGTTKEKLTTKYPQTRARAFVVMGLRIIIKPNIT